MCSLPGRWDATWLDGSLLRPARPAARATPPPTASPTPHTHTRHPNQPLQVWPHTENGRGMDVSNSTQHWAFQHGVQWWVSQVSGACAR